MTPSERRWLAAGLGLVAAAIALRVANAQHYFINWGFDAAYNWKYVQLLTEFWVIPDPHYSWSTSRPPLFFQLAGALARVFGPEVRDSVVAIRIASSLLGVVAVVPCAWLVRRCDPGRPARAFLAAALLLFLPAHIYMSAMLNEEILVSSLTTFAIFLAALDVASPQSGRAAWWRAVGIGVAAGLALLTKLTGLLVGPVAVAAILLRGWRGGVLGPAVKRAALVLALTAAVGGWFYMRSWVLYGFLYPQALETHELMFQMPPGERNVGDYLRVPLSTWTNPRLDDPDLLRSVWGGTYATLWYDAQRHFLPRDVQAERVRRMGLLILVLALLPSAAFAYGMARGLRRARADPAAPDTPMLLLVGVTLAGYVLYTWHNPWYATVKGGYLLGLGLPFGYWASEGLSLWMRGPRWRSVAIASALFALLVAVALAFSFETPLWSMRILATSPGLPWWQQP